MFRHWGGWKKLRMAAGGTVSALQTQSAGETKKKKRMSEETKLIVSNQEGKLLDNKKKSVI